VGRPAPPSDIAAEKPPTPLPPTDLVVAEKPDPSAHQCDILAASPTDPARLAPGVEDDAIDVGAALRACRDALRDDPKQARFWFQLGRVLNVAGSADQAKEALYWLNKAHEAGFTEATVRIASAYLSDQAGDAGDRTKGLDLLFTAAGENSLAAFMALGDAYRDGAGVAKDPREAPAWSTTIRKVRYTTMPKPAAGS
jgi:hypothetical protein